MNKTVDHTRLKKLLGMLGSEHDGEVLSAARRIDEMIRRAEVSWDALIVAPPQPKAPLHGDMRLLDDLLESANVSDVLKIRLSTMRAALIADILPESDRRFLRLLHRKAVIDGTIIVN